MQIGKIVACVDFYRLFCLIISWSVSLIIVMFENGTLYRYIVHSHTIPKFPMDELFLYDQSMQNTVNLRPITNRTSQNKHPKTLALFCS